MHTVDQATLDEVIRRIVEVAQPERIILFGSAGRAVTAQQYAEAIEAAEAVVRWVERHT